MLLQSPWSTPYSGASLVATYSVIPTQTLLPNQPVEHISGVKGTRQYWKLTVPPGQAKLSFMVTAAVGDVDMFVQYDRYPREWAPHCQWSNELVNFELCSFDNPAAGDWYVALEGDWGGPYSDATLVATYSTQSGIPTLTNGEAIGDLSGLTDSTQSTKLTVPPGQTQLVFTLSGGCGDADLYVRFGSAPTLTSFDCRPQLNGNEETCVFANPQAGDWHVMLRGKTPYYAATLRGQYQ